MPDASGHLGKQVEGHGGMKACGRVQVVNTDDGATADEDEPSQPLGIVVLELLLRIFILASKAFGTARTGVVNEDDLVAAARLMKPSAESQPFCRLSWL
ncbi:hypothetical protein PtA15_11A106 [Puccinia triticina]|uniref:Uncharacterized protein n=1 Tax=Puccinia triticina TaxID=208348 RepID=A0ABY7CWW2_9BASI|nr:uncharacterized protein PtA15_11A106 [Puccinia triticina]WAQ89418.1 hypothetical protein PtA15_11A106 [Puccinia triticina]WAR59474.1 hypothetical protein PtB15_11B114 [Puccinia triticina]